MPRYAQGRLPALEQNILKYRAMEMVLILFYVEELKNLVVDAIRATDRFRNACLSDSVISTEHLPKAPQKPYRQALEILVTDRILNKSQAKEIVELINYRNHIAHSIHLLTADIGGTQLAKDFAKFLRERGPRYDYGALRQIRFYKDLLDAQLSQQYVRTISFDPLLFESAERTFDGELRRLRQKITKQLARQKQKIARAR